MATRLEVFIAVKLENLKGKKLGET